MYHDNESGEPSVRFKCGGKGDKTRQHRVRGIQLHETRRKCYIVSVVSKGAMRIDLERTRCQDSADTLHSKPDMIVAGVKSA